MTDNNFHRQEETRGRFPNVPVKYAFMYDAHAGVMLAKFIFLQLDQIATNFDDIILCAIIDLQMLFPKVIENVHGKSSVARSNFVNYEIFVWEIFEQIL